MARCGRLAKFLDAARAETSRRGRELAVEVKPLAGPVPATDDTLWLYFLCAHPSPRVLYPVFKEGYSGDIDLAAEAIRLTRHLAASTDEPEVSGLLANKEIAARLFVATGIVKSYVNSIFRRLGVESRTQAVAQARVLHLLTD